MNTTPDKKMTPMEELIEQLKKLSPESPMDNDVSKAFHVGIKLAILKAKFLLEAEREYASQQAPASNQPVSAMEDVFAEIREERTKQDAKWGEQNHAPADWLMILGEEVGEVNKAALEAKFGSSTLREYREELVQVAAVTVAMIECFDRNHLPPPQPSK